MQIIQVKSNKTERLFLDCPKKIYKNDKAWVCPLDSEIKDIFDPKKNVYYKQGEAERWILMEDGKVIGRIAAFIDFAASNNYDQPTGGMGFFECINKQDAANVLFDSSKEWLQSKGMEAMDGPINFGETDKFWGLLVGGFTQPAYNVAYHAPYYQNLFENYGFKVYYRQEGFHLDLSKPINERFIKIAERVNRNSEYTFEHFSFKEMEKYVSDFTEVFNNAWRDFKNDFEPLSTDYVRKFLKDGKAVLEEKFIWLVYHKGKPISIYLMIPDLNQIFKPFKGKLNLLNKLRVLYMVKTKKLTRAKGILMGVIPEYQKKGIESIFLLKVYEQLAKMPQYTEVEFSFVADFNPTMRKIWLTIGAEPAKDYITYRYLFDREKEFKRYPIPTK